MVVVDTKLGKAEIVDTSIDKRILIGMIVSDSFLAHVSAHLSASPFDDKWSGLITKWCLDFQQTYEKAPGAEIQSIFNAWARKNPDLDDIADRVQEVLSHLSDIWETASEEINVPYLIDQAEERFNFLRLRRVAEDLNESLSAGQTEEAEAVLNEYSKIELSQASGVNPFYDSEVFREAFDKESEDLITFKGALGEFFRGQLARDCFVAIQAPEKRGKSWMLLELMYRALQRRRKVVLFEVGDMSQGQVIQRLGTRLTGKPSRKWLCGTFPYPIGMDRKKGKSPEVFFEDRTVDEPVLWKEGFNIARAFAKKFHISEKQTFKLSCHPNSSINVRQINNLLDTWERQDEFIPDVIVIDYADILAPEDLREDHRESINTTWKALRRLSQERHCLVLTATQADASSYDGETQGMGNFSEDKRKHSHVTGVFALNQKDTEKAKGLMRLNWIAVREGDYNSSRCLWVTSCLRIGRPCIDAIW